MLFYIQSTDPSCYGTIRFSTNTFIGRSDLEFRINQLCTNATFLITTEQDYVIIEVEGSEGVKDESITDPQGPRAAEQKTYYFEERYKYDRDMLASEMSKLIDNFTFADNDSGTLSLENKDKNTFRIVDASHRAKVLLGLYHTDLPTPWTHRYDVKSVPLVCYGNQLYLRSRISSIVGFNDAMNNETYISLCYHIFEILFPGMPVICRQAGKVTKIKPTDLTNLEFTLVDFQNEPVLLKSPLSIVLEILVPSLE